jgi:hypothetical protein
MRTVTAAALLVACGPPNRVSPIGDLPFPVESSYLTVDPGTFDADDLLTVTLSSLPGSCDAERVFRDGAADAEDPAALAEAWAAAFPAAFTEVEVVARVQGGTWPVKGSLWSGLAWDALPEQNNVAFAVFTQHLALRDEAWWAGEVEDEDAYEQVFYSDGGLMKWGTSEPGVRVSGRLNADVVSSAGAFAGSSEVRFDATICGL